MNIFLIGAMRSGTTTLYNCLCNHPEIHKGKRKEINYYSLHYERGLDWYQRQVKNIDASPFYLNHSEAAQRIHKDYPNAKIIVILRNPIERAYSQYMYVKERWETISFEDAIVWETIRLEQYAQNTYEYMVYSYLRMSRYYERLQSYYSLFDDILVLQSESYYRNHQETLDRAFDFLGLDSVKVDLQYQRQKYEPMRDYTRDYLKEYFKDKNESLFELVKDRFEWI